ncbi:MAG: gliding motility-associated C-terminal domain-containing protein [Flavobacteriales bacterium]|nr:gliding motility-associated C-terminal domain-containing protein [Flavobacteriales bacterium]
MRTILFVFLSHILCSTVLSQSNWLRSEGGQLQDEALDVCNDAEGNYIICGYFTGTSSIGSTTLYTQGQSDILIAKYNSSGILLWAETAGGVAGDHATAIATDDDGNIYVTGYFTAQSAFGNFELTATSSSREVFVTKLDADGNFQWVTRLGGHLEDESTAIEMDNAGNVLVTGFFRGIGDFGTENLSSTINTETEEHSRDIFLSKLGADGNVQWTRQGIAEKNDIGNDVACDQDGNVMLVGKFSGDITFDELHTNQVNYASFITLFSSTGDELLFEKALGAFLSINQVETTSSGQFVLGGNVSGYVTFFAGQPQSFFTPGEHALFLCALNNDGSVQWLSSDGSNNNVTLDALTISSTDELYVAGTFQCTFDDFAADFGPGSFNSVGFRDVYAAKYSASGTRQWQRQFAGKADDFVGGIAIQVEDKPIVAGSYEGVFNVPHHTSFLPGDGTIKTTPNYGSNCTPAETCTDVNLRKFNQVLGNGQREIFVSSPVHLARLPYYYYRNNLTDCFMIQPQLEIYNTDSLSCNSAYLGNNFLTCPEANNNFATWQWATWYQDYNIIPAYTSSWHPDIYYSAILNLASVSDDGEYWLSFTTVDGCYAQSDTIEIVVYDSPPHPLISDNVGINTLAYPADDIILCGTDSVQLTATVPDGMNVYWSGFYGGLDYDSLLTVTQSGDYTVYVNNDTCTALSTLMVQLDESSFENLQMGVAFKPPFFFDPLYFSPTEVFTSDTVFVCPNTTQVVAYFFEDSGTDDYSLYTGVSSAYFNITIGGVPLVNDTIPASHLLLPANQGDLEITMQAFFECDGLISESEVFQQVIHFEVLPQANIISASQLCPGSTLLLVATGYDAFEWNGPGTTSTAGIVEIISPDSILINQPGNYYATATGFENSTVCTSALSSYITITTQTSPVASMNPSNGVLCIGSTVQLMCSGSGIFSWYNVEGDFIASGASIAVDEPGYYQCQLINSTGCQLYSNIVQVQGYFAPTISAAPTTEVCPGLSTFIIAETNAANLILWQPPLSGNNPVQEIFEPGIYTFTQQLCGITSAVSIAIGEIIPLASIQQSSTLCAGDSALFIANPDLLAYQWFPSGATNDSLYISTADTLVVMTTDYLGCNAFSDSLIVPLQDFQPEIVSPEIACEGSTTTIEVNYVDSISWFSNEALTEFISSDTLLYLEIIGDSITVYLSDTYQDCQFDPIEVTVITSQLPDAIITGDTVLCTNETIELFSQGEMGVSYDWTSPNDNVTTENNLVLTDAAISDSGFYLLTVQDSLCSNTDSLFVIIYPLPVVSLVPDGNISFCDGEETEAEISGAFATFTWFLNDDEFNSTSTTLTLEEAGTYFAEVVSIEGCENISEELTITLWEIPPIPILLGVEICEGDSAVVTGSGEFILHWLDENGEPVDVGDTLVLYDVEAYTTLFGFILSPQGCESAIAETQVSVIPCEGILANIFTPNGDDKNDVFSFNVFLEYPQRVLIFDRWGNEVMVLREPFLWDGRDASGNLVSGGTYYYVIEFGNSSYQLENKAGYVYVVR